MTGDRLLPDLHFHADALSVVILTVATTPEMTAQITDAAATKHWNVTYSHHKEFLSSARRPALSRGVKSNTFYVAFVDFDESVAQASEAAQYLAQTFAGHITIVAVGSSQTPDLMLAAMRAGCNEFLAAPTESALTELLDSLEARWLDTSTVERSAQGAVLAVFGSKGGVGATTLAVHLAVFLVQRHNKRTLLIDSRSELGHACVYLGMDGSRCHLDEVVRNFNRLDSELLRGFVGQHSSGLHVLSSPDVSGAGITMNADAVARTVAFLRSEYDYVVVDSGPPLDAIGSAVLEAASQIYLVATPEIGAVRDLSRYIDRLVPHDSFAEKLQVVLNRAGAHHAIHADQIEKAIKLPITLHVPDCYADLMRSENLGEPISPHANLELAQAFVGWADSIVGAPGHRKAASKKTGLFAMLKQMAPPRVAVTRAQ